MMSEARNPGKRTADSSSCAANQPKRNATQDKTSSGDSAPGAPMACFSSIPVEVLSDILSFLTLSERMKLATVSHRWHQAVNLSMARCRHFSSVTIPGMGLVTTQTLEKICSRLRGLRSLTNIVGSDLDVDIVSRHCPHLEQTDLSCFRVDVPSLKRLCRNCPKLAVLTLPECDDDCVETVFRGLPELRSLTLEMSNVTGRCLALLPASLQRLSLQEDVQLKSAEIGRASRCPLLTELDITELYSPPFEVLAELLAICPRLERLRVNSDITDTFLKRLPEMTPGIRHLNLTDCTGLTEDGLMSLGRLKELRSLHLTQTDTTDRVLDQLCGAFHLTKLVVGTEPYRGPDFSEEALARLAMSCPSLRWLMVTEMVDAEDLVRRLTGQLSPDRDLTIFMNDTALGNIDAEDLPEDDAPLQLTTYSDWEDD